LFDRRRSIKLMCVMCESPRELVTHVSHHITNLRASQYHANFNLQLRTHLIPKELKEQKRILVERVSSVCEGVLRYVGYVCM
jgi:hypothetical protein